MRACPAFALFAVLAIACSLPAGPASGLPPGPEAGPVLTITLEPTTMAAWVTESAGQTARFDGYAKLENPPREYVNVTLAASVDTGWYAKCTPAFLNLSHGQTEYFKVEVMVAPATLAATVGTLEVRANSTGRTYSLDTTCRATITTLQYYRLEVEADTGYIEAPPSTPATFTLRVRNVGNGPDGFRVELANRDHLYGQGWTVDIVPDTLTRVLPGESKTTEVTVTPPHEWVLWKTEPEVITIRANSTGALSDQLVISMAYHLYLYQKGADSLSLYSLITLILLGVLALSYWAVRRRRARKRRPAPPEPDEPIDVEPY
jgi:hypothetical protein